MKKPRRRDFYDWLMFAVGAVGVYLVVVTLRQTQSIANSSSRDMARALGSMANIAGTLKGQQKAIIHQSEATVNLAEETNTVANANDLQAKNGKIAIGIAKQEADTASKQLRQNFALAVAAQRPIMQYDPNSKNNSFHIVGSEAFWNYGYKNYGKTPAYRLRIDHWLSVRDLPRQHDWINDSVVPPDDPRDALAVFKFPPNETAPEEVAHAILRVRLVYFDGFGQRHVDRFCRKWHYDRFKKRLVNC